MSRESGGMEIIMIKKRICSMFVLIIMLVPTVVWGSVENANVVIGINEVITPKLWEIIEKATDEELIPVTIELRDNMDEAEIEKTALEKSNLTMDKIQEIESAPSLLSDEENIEFQKENSKIYDNYKKEIIIAVKEHNSSKNAKFMVENNLHNKECHSVSILTPFIRGVYLTKDEIIELAQNSDIIYIHPTDFSECEDFASLEFTKKIIGGDLAISEGYTGTGIKVGNIESGHPNLETMGTDGTGITKTNSGSTTDHATIVCAILKKMAPDCTIYTRAVGTPADIVDAANNLINVYQVDVINIVCGRQSEYGEYSAESRELDYLVKTFKVPVVVAAGQSNDSSNTSKLINRLGMAPNVITVGFVSTLGSDPSASNAFIYRDNNYYMESSNCINKPDVCAPGNVSVYAYNNYSGTSFAAPHVTGTIVQMMCRNVWLKNQPETVKAALMASAQYNAGTSMSYVPGTIVSNKEGSGVINAGFCYRVAKNGRRAYFDATASDTLFTQDIYCDYSTKPFRVACTWDVISDAEIKYTKCTNYDMKIYKNGVLVASSTAYSHSTSQPKTNYEIIEIPTTVLSQYGAGYYQVQIVRVGDFQGSGTVRIGLAWEQN